MVMVGLGFGVSLICGTELRVHYEDVSFVAIQDELVPFSAVWLAENDNPALRRFLSFARRLTREEKNAVASQTPDPSP